MVLTESGHVQLAKSMFNEDFRFAWGTLDSDEEWGNNPPPEDINDTQLKIEVGRIKSQVKEYVIPDEDGVIEVDNMKWSISESPTKYIYLKFVFDQSHNANDTIYQLGIFTNTVPEPDNVDDEYLQPSQIADFGDLIYLRNQPALVRNSATRESYEFVIVY
jgi:hypothetical protein